MATSCVINLIDIKFPFLAYLGVLEAEPGPGRVQTSSPQSSPESFFSKADLNVEILDCMAFVFNDSD